MADKKNHKFAVQNSYPSKEQPIYRYLNTHPHRNSNLNTKYQIKYQIRI